MLLLLAHVPNAHAATKTLNASGQGKLLAWAQKVARIYGTALKNMPSGVKKTEDLDIYIYARSADGLFTTSWYARVNYTNSNMTFTPTCMGAGTSDTQDNLHCISNLHPTAYKDYGAYASTMPVGDFGMDPYEPQTAFGSGHGACLNNRIKTINLSCLIGVRKYVSSKATTNLWAILSTKAVGTGCQASAALPVSLSPVSSISCATKAALNNIKSKLKDYKTYLGTCNNGVLPAAMNIDLTELEEVLNDMQNGYLLADGDITPGDTYPPIAKNPWTFVNPTLAPEGDVYQEHLPDNEVPNKFKVKVTNAGGGVPIDFTVSGAPSNNWAFLPDNTGRSVTRTANSIAETRFKLGSGTGIYTIKATCAECCPGEVVLTAKALTANEATRLKEVFCDGTYFAGQTLPYPLRVQAYNKFTTTPRDGMMVYFAKTPVDKGALSVDRAATELNSGIARTWLTLGSLASGIDREQYTITATCPGCLANTTVTCPVEAVKVPDQINMLGDLEMFQEEDDVSITVSPDVVSPQNAGDNTIAAVTISASPNTDFTATIKPIPYSGGHQHDTNRPTGSWREQATTPQNVYSGRTNSMGSAVLTYVSGDVGGEEIVEVVTDSGWRGRKFVYVRLAGISPLPRSSDYFQSGTTDRHPNNHYGTTGLVTNLTRLATAFKSDTALSASGVLSINDMSLISGGVFDTNGNWKGDNTNTHLCHRRGTSVDLDRGTYKNDTITPIKNMARKINALLQANPQVDCRVVFEKKNQAGKCMVHLECPSSPVTCSSNESDCEE